MAAQLVELGLAVLLKRLAHHLRGQARLHVLVARDLLVFVGYELVFGPKLGRHLLAQGARRALPFGAHEIHLGRQGVALALERRTRLGHRQLLLSLEGARLRGRLLLQLGDARVFGRSGLGERPSALDLRKARLVLALVL